MSAPAYLTGSPQRVAIALCSDIHYAGAREKARGEDYEFHAVANPIQRFALRTYRRAFWMRHQLANNPLLDEFLQNSAGFEHAIANGDYAVDSGSVGLSDEATFEAASLCLTKLRTRFGANLRANFGDHELGKLSFYGNYGGVRLASWRRAVTDLRLQPFWRWDVGCYVLLGVVSSLVALPVFEPDMLPEEREEWQRLREEHLRCIREAFAGLSPNERVVLFCHDPTALPFLGREATVQQRLPQVELTVIGHLHSNLILWKSRVLSGMPRLSVFGPSIARISGALRDARAWRPFRVKLCPSLAGIQWERGGGWCSLELDPSGASPLKFRTHPLRRGRPTQLTSKP
jgi:hypothetical protein